MTSEQIVTIIVAIIGSGVLSAVVAVVGNRKKTNADAQSVALDSLSQTAKTLMEVAELRIKNLCDRVEGLESKVSILQDAVQERELKIDTLGDENRKLQDLVKKLQEQNESLRRRVKELETQLFELIHPKK